MIMILIDNFIVPILLAAKSMLLTLHSTCTSKTNTEQGVKRIEKRPQ